MLKRTEEKTEVNLVMKYEESTERSLKKVQSGVPKESTKWSTQKSTE
jgi:hypothetical protein